MRESNEEAFDYSYYTGASTGDSPYDATHWAGPEGYICPSEVVYAMPKRAQNVEGKWRVIVNDVHYYSQTARLETCLFPEAACRALAPCYQSHCTQKSVYHRLLSFDPCDPYRGLFIDIYKMPSACSCHIPA
ncbi:neurotrophin 1-like [Penaeus vannamei]|uniref:neurotrophin 1-like n=1 Tax=Penaeus vannamei TaxID=6689 RepID=UPI00387F9F31